MRLHSKELGLSGRLGVPKLGIVGGLLVLLMLVAAACDDKAQPTGPYGYSGVTRYRRTDPTGDYSYGHANPTASRLHHANASFRDL